MDLEGNKFGQGPRELTGGVDLITHFKLLPHHDFFCKRSLPFSVSDTHYLNNVVGETEIRKGEGMQLDQLVQNAVSSREFNNRIQPFDIDTLRDAFSLMESIPVDLPLAEKGMPAISGKPKTESNDKKKKHKRHKDREKDKDREHKKHKHRHKDKSKDKEKKDKGRHHDFGVDSSKKHHKKKKKREGDEALNNHGPKQSKHISLKLGELGVMRVVG